jgi:hypothetical protein
MEAPLFELPALPPCTAAADSFCGTESRAVLDNPHQGFTSFSGYASSLPAAKHPRARVAYTRYWWNELEPEPGAVRFEVIDEALAKAAAEGQTFAFRVMPEESRDGARRVPLWLATSAGGRWGTHSGSGRYFSPDYDSPAFLEAAERTIAALGAHYDADPRLEHVDVGFVGDTGEWAYVVDGASMPSAESTRRILAAFAKAFTRTPVLMAIGAVDDGAAPLAQALSLGMGWRADCWGDLRRPWNHHDDFYEAQLQAADAGEAWQRSPVAVETCGEMETWDTLGYEEAQVRWLLRWALDHHVSLINNKSRAIPARFRPLVDEYLSFAGARLFVRQVTRVGSSVVQVEIVNRGSAPSYRPWRLSSRVRGGEAISMLLADSRSLTFNLPAMQGPIDVTVLDESGAPVLLANEGVRDDGWLEAFPQ